MEKKFIVLIIVAIIEILVIGFFIIKLIISAKKGLHNIKKCDDELFKNIDKFRRSLGDSNDNFIRQLQIINLYYKPDGKVDSLVNTRQVERLFKRKDFLMKKRRFFNDVGSYMSALIISLIASLLYHVFSQQNSNYILFFCVFTLIMFFLTVLAKYSKRGKQDSYKYLVEEYERKLLDLKIKQFRNEVVITSEDEKILSTHQVAIDTLIDFKFKFKFLEKKDKKGLDRDIKIVDNLNLCIGNYSDVYVQKVLFGGKEAYLLYDLKRGLENNYIGKLNLKTAEFSILYDIMEKYNMITFISNNDQQTYK